MDSRLRSLRRPWQARIHTHTHARTVRCIRFLCYSQTLCNRAWLIVTAVNIGLSQLQSFKKVSTEIEIIVWHITKIIELIWTSNKGDMLKEITKLITCSHTFQSKEIRRLGAVLLKSLTCCLLSPIKVCCVIMPEALKDLKKEKTPLTYYDMSVRNHQSHRF